MTDPVQPPIVCHASSPRILNLIYDLAKPMRVSFRQDGPGAADVVVTTAGLTGTAELLASRIGAVVIVLPEGAPYLASQLKAGRWRVICDLGVLSESTRGPGSDQDAEVQTP